MASIYRLESVGSTAAFEGACCAFGVFDGLHIGHRHIIETASFAARSHDRPAAVATFDIDPDEIFAAGRVCKLMSNEDRLALLAACDIDAVIVFPFTRSFAAMPPSQFLDAAFGRYLPKALYVGSDFRFGCQARGTVRDLCSWAALHGMTVHALDLLQKDGEAVSSTRIRRCLAEGSVEEANRLLGRPYTVHSQVCHGRGQGRRMGFCTANLKIPSNLLVLAQGVYAAYADVGGTKFKAAASVGISPSFARISTANMEIHLLDFEGDLYTHELEVSFMHYLRPMKKFSCTQDLVSAVQNDIDAVRRYL